jgi:hypothetical protein
MKHTTLVRAFFAVILTTLFGSLFSTASAATVSIINNWQNPAPYSFYSYTSPVHVVGSYTLPPDWVGTIYVWQDGVQLPQTLTVSNLGGVTPKNASFDINLGIQPALPSPHEISIEFFGGASCFILNTCPGTSSNWTDESIVPRTYTASNTPDPVLAISYDANGTTPLQSPAFDFANVPMSTTDTRTLYVRNVGGGTAIGAASIAGGSNPFYCVGTCTYSILAGAPAIPIQVQYAPGSAGMTSSGVLAFGCTSPNCAGVNANLTGSSVASAVPPQLDLSDSYLGYGYVNINQSVDQDITIYNTGGGILSGSMTFGDPSYSCIPGCNYAIPAGGSYTITVRFNPTTGGGHDTSATFTGGVTPETIYIYGSGNDQPIIDLNCVGCDGVGAGGQYHWDLPNPVAPGQTLYQTIEVSNVGVGVLSGEVTPTPGSWNTAGWHCVSVTQGGVTTPYTDATPCTYSNLVYGGPPAIVQMSFVGSVANVGPQHDYAYFSNTPNPSDGPDALELSAAVTVDPLLNITGLGGELVFVDTLVNVATSDLYGNASDAILLENVGTTPLTVVINLPVGAGVFTCVNPLHCNTPIIIAAGATVPVAFSFNPPTPYFYNQAFSICVSGTCGNYNMRGLGQNPQLGIMSVIPGGQNMDLMKICAEDGNTCAFTGTKTVYYGNNIKNVSKLATGGVMCDTPSFGSDPAPGIGKYCWYANTNSGTWTNKPWTTSNLFGIYNSGIGGTVYYKIISPTNFKCSTSRSWSGYCQSYVTNYDEQDFTYNYDINFAPIYFNPTIAGPISQSLRIDYHFVAWDGNSPPDCNYCHSTTTTLTGTGISGAHLFAITTPFPVTNVGASSTVNLTVYNDGTTADNGVTVNYVSGEFSCTANCGPYDLAPGGSQLAQVTFSPTSAGTKNGSFLITSTDPVPVGPASITVPMTGVGNASPVVGILNPVGGSLDYGVVNQGSQRVSGDGTLPAIIVTNTGAGLLTGDATLVDTVHYVCVSCHYEALANGQQQEIKIAFVPKSVSPPALNNTVNFSGGNAPINFLLYGQGALGASSINSPDTNFGRVVIRPGNFKEQVVTVYNLGSVDVAGGDISLTGPFSCTHPPTPFNAVTSKCSYPAIPAGGSVQFTIRFTPTAPGAASGVLSLGGSSNARVRLSGTGVVPSVKFRER